MIYYHVRKLFQRLSLIGYREATLVPWGWISGHATLRWDSVAFGKWFRSCSHFSWLLLQRVRRRKLRIHRFKCGRRAAGTYHLEHEVYRITRTVWWCQGCYYLVYSTSTSFRHRARFGSRFRWCSWHSCVASYWRGILAKGQVWSPDGTVERRHFSAWSCFAPERCDGIVNLHHFLETSRDECMLIEVLSRLSRGKTDSLQARHVWCECYKVAYLNWCRDAL